MVFAGVQRDAGISQCAAHPGVAGQRVGLVVVVGVDRLHGQLLGQRRQCLARIAVQHDQPAAGCAMGLAQLAQLVVQVNQAVADELDPPVLARQWRQDGGVEGEHAPNLARGAQRVVKRGVVVGAQVAAEPNQGTGQDRRGGGGGGHGLHRLSVAHH